MPAWSVPGSHSVLKPLMRCMRVSASMIVWLKPWPMCSVPVTLGGGNWIENDGLARIERRHGGAAGFPARRPFGFDGGGLEGLGEFGRRHARVCGERRCRLWKQAEPASKHDACQRKAGLKGCVDCRFTPRASLWRTHHAESRFTIAAPPGLGPARRCWRLAAAAATAPPGAVSCSVADEQRVPRQLLRRQLLLVPPEPQAVAGELHDHRRLLRRLAVRRRRCRSPAAAARAWPSDRYSGFQSTESFNRFFGDGQTLSYGLAVAGLEVTGQPNAPLYVRYLEPAGPAARAGVLRGERIMSLNGRPAATSSRPTTSAPSRPTLPATCWTWCVRNAAGPIAACASRPASSA